jgi:hypothetical protein
VAFRESALAALNVEWVKARAMFAGFLFFDAQSQANMGTQLDFARMQINKLGVGGDWFELDDAHWTALANECGRGIADIQNQLDDQSGLTRIWKELVVPTAKAVVPVIEGFGTVALVLGGIWLFGQLRSK